MPAEVYSAIKPAAAYRSWVISLFLLLLASALAGDMATRGSGGWRAGDLIKPEGWEMIFRAPAQFEEINPDPQRFGATYVFEHRDANGILIQLTFWRMRAEGATAFKVARTILEESRSWFSLFLGPPPTKSVGRLGNRDALEVLDPAVPLVLRALVWESGWAYAVSLRVEGAPIDEKLYALFEMTCQSVQFRKPGV